MRYLFIHAHPDDETLSSGVLMSEFTHRGDEVFLLTATRGEQGEIVSGSLPNKLNELELAAYREKELAAALRILGVKGHAFLGTFPARLSGLPNRVYQDSGMEWVTSTMAGPAIGASAQALSISAIEDEVADAKAYCEYIKPDLIISYDADGGYGHPDHIRSYEIMREIHRQTQLKCATLVYKKSPEVQWFDLPNRLPEVVLALKCHRTQLTVVGSQIVHSGGQCAEIVTSLGLKFFK